MSNSPETDGSALLIPTDPESVIKFLLGTIDALHATLGVLVGTGVLDPGALLQAARSRADFLQSAEGSARAAASTLLAEWAGRASAQRPTLGAHREFSFGITDGLGVVLNTLISRGLIDASLVHAELVGTAANAASHGEEIRAVALRRLADAVLLSGPSAGRS